MPKPRARTVGRRRYDGPMNPSGSTSSASKTTAPSTASTPMPTAIDAIRMWARRNTRASLGRARGARSVRQSGHPGRVHAQPDGVPGGQPEVERCHHIELTQVGPADQPELARGRPDVDDHAGQPAVTRDGESGPAYGDRG